MFKRNHSALGVCRRIPSSARLPPGGERAFFRLARTAKQAISVHIVDAAGRRPVKKQAARSQIGFSDRLLVSAVFLVVLLVTLTMAQTAIQPDQGWVMKNGDNPALAAPAFDDSELISLAFTPKNANGIYVAPDPLAVTIDIENHASVSHELRARFEWRNDRVDESRVLHTVEKTIQVGSQGKVSQAIEFAPPAPGFYYVVCTLNEHMKQAMVLGYEPEKIKSPLTRPADFEAFWKARKQDLADIAPQFKMTRDNRSTDQVDVYLVEMQSYGHVTIRGWYTVPKQPGPHPAILSVPGYTSTMRPYLNRIGVATLALNPRGHGNSKDDVDPKGEEYMFLGFDPEHPEKYIYTGAYLDCVRAVDFLASRPEIDCSRIGVEGGSQGGGLSFATAALDPRIVFCAPDIPWLGDWVGYLEASRWGHENYPKLFKTYPDLTFAGINRLLSYFDTMNMAEWITCPVLMSVGLQDDVCPPRTSFAPYNAVTSKKDYRVYPFAGHDVPQAHTRLKNQWMAAMLDIDTI